MSAEMDMDAQLERLMERMNELREIILEFRLNMEMRLDAIGERLERIADKLDALDARLAKLDEAARREDDSPDFIM